MALSDKLKQIKDEEQQQQQAMREKQEKRAAERTEFQEKGTALFNGFLKSKMESVLNEFKAAKFDAHYGQDVKRISYANGGGTISMSVRLRSCVMQIDVSQNNTARQFDMNFTFTSAHKLDNQKSFNLSDFTEAAIDKIIEANVDAMDKHCR